MNPFRRIILASTLILAGVSVAAFSQVAKPKNLKPLDEKVQSEKDKQDPSSAGLKKLTRSNEDRNEADFDVDIDFDFEKIRPMVSETVQSALKSLEISIPAIPDITIPMESIRVNMESIRIEPIVIDPIEVNIYEIEKDMEDWDFDIDDENGDKDKDKSKNKEKVKDKDQEKNKDKSKEKDKEKEEKSKGLTKIKGS